jgi:hypothetical protein
MDYYITEEERDACRRDGAVPLRGVVDGDWLKVLEAGIERDISDPGPFVHGYVPDNGIGKFHGKILH